MRVERLSKSWLLRYERGSVLLIARNAYAIQEALSGKFSSTSTLFLRSPERFEEIALVSKVAYYAWTLKPVRIRQVWCQR